MAKECASESRRFQECASGKFSDESAEVLVLLIHGTHSYQLSINSRLRHKVGGLPRFGWTSWILMRVSCCRFLEFSSLAVVVRLSFVVWCLTTSVVDLSSCFGNCNDLSSVWFVIVLI